MREFIYQENGKYYRALTDFIGKVIHKKEISKKEYLKIREDLLCQK